MNKPNMWVSFTAPSTGSIKINTAESNYFYNLFPNDCQNLNAIASYEGDEDNTYINGLTSGQTYLLSVGKNNVVSSMDFCIETNSSTATNIECTAASSQTSNTPFTFESGKAVVDPAGSSGNCEAESGFLWYSFSATNTDMIFQGTDIEHTLYSGSCGSLTELTEITFGEDLIYENLTVNNTYYLKLTTGTITDLNASITVSIDDYTRVNGNHTTCANALLVMLDETMTDYDLGVSISLSPIALPNCLSIGAGLADSWVVTNAVDNGLYIENVNAEDTYVLYTGTCGSLSEIACYTEVDNDFIQFGNLTIGNQYYLRKIAPENSSMAISIGYGHTLNGSCDGAIVVPVAAEGNTSISMKSMNATSFHSTGSCDSKISLWYEFTAPAGGNVILQNHEGGVAVYEDNCTSLTEVSCETNTASSSLSLDLIPNTTYKLKLSFDEYNSDERSFVLIAGVPSTPETNCSQAPVLPVSDITCNQSVSSTTSCVLLSNGSFCGDQQRGAVFYQFTADDDASYRFEISNAAAAHAFTIFADCSLANAISCGNSPLEATLSNGVSYIIAVYPQDQNTTSSFDLCAYPSPEANNGNVGVGVTNPQVKLEVNGGIKPGNTAMEMPGLMRWNNDLEVYDGIGWKSLTEWDYTADQDIDMQNNRIQNVQDPVLPTDVATKAYVDQFPDNDNSPSNEIQSQTVMGDTLKTSHGGGFVIFDTYYDNELITDFTLNYNNILGISEPNNSFTLDLTKYDNGWLYNTSTDELTYDHNIGIKDLDPSQSLSVTGTIRASETDAETKALEIKHNGVNGILNTVGTGSLVLQHNGSSKMHVLSNGNIGMGIKSPTEELSVVGTIRAKNTETSSDLVEITHNGTDAVINKTGVGNILFSENGNPNVAIEPGGDVGIGDYNPSVALNVVGTVRASTNASEVERTEISHTGSEGILNTVGDGDLLFQHDSDTKMTIKDNGNVGIGDTNPNTPLAVVGLIRTSTNSAETERIELAHDGANAEINTVGDGSLQFQHDSDTKMTIKDDGNVGIGDTNPTTPLGVVGMIRTSTNSAETERIELAHNGSNAEINTVGDGSLQFQHDGSTKMTIKDDGNVGIGTTDPIARLHIAGSSGDAILLNNNQTKIKHGADLLDTKNSDLRFLIDSDNNGSGDNFSLYNNILTSGSTTPKVNISLAGLDSYFDIGQIGIGVTNPNDRLHISSDAGENALRVQVGGATKFRVFANGSLSLGSNNSSITDNNVYVHTNLGIGDTDPSEKLSVVGKVRASAASNENEFTEITHNGANGIINTEGDGNLLIQHDDNSVIVAEPGGDVGIGTTNPTDQLHINAPNNQDALRVDVNGSIKMRVYDNGSIALGGNNTGISDNDVYIANSLGIGTAVPDRVLHVQDFDSNNPIALIKNTSTNLFSAGLAIEIGPTTNPSAANRFIRFQDGDGTLIGSVSGNNSGGINYNTTSDRRLKMNIESCINGLGIINKMQPRTYERISNPGKKEIGFIAQELYEVFPQVVAGTPENDIETPMMVDYGQMTPVIVAALKEQQEQIEAQNKLIAEQAALIKILMASQNEMKASIDRIEGEAKNIK